MTPEEVIKNHLIPLENALTEWIESPYVAQRCWLNPTAVSAMRGFWKASD